MKNNLSSKEDGSNNQVYPNTPPQRVVKAKVNIMCSQNPRSTSMCVHTTCFREGIAINFVSKPNDSNQAGYIYPIL